MCGMLSTLLGKQKTVLCFEPYKSLLKFNKQFHKNVWHAQLGAARLSRKITILPFITEKITMRV